MPVLEKSTIPQVALEDMNAVHYEEVDLINRIDELLARLEEGAAAPEALDALLTELQDHMIEHFRGEEERMAASGFPPYPIHKGEHDRVLLELGGLIDRWKRERELDPVVRYVRESFPVWFEQHLGTMDAVTADFLARVGA